MTGTVTIKGSLKQSIILFGQFKTELSIPCLIKSDLFWMTLVANWQICCFSVADTDWFRQIMRHPHELARPAVTENLMLMGMNSVRTGRDWCKFVSTCSWLHTILSQYKPGWTMSIFTDQQQQAITTLNCHN